MLSTQPCPQRDAECPWGFFSVSPQDGARAGPRGRPGERHPPAQHPALHARGGHVLAQPLPPAAAAAAKVCARGSQPHTGLPACHGDTDTSLSSPDMIPMAINSPLKAHPRAAPSPASKPPCISSSSRWVSPEILTGPAESFTCAVCEKGKMKILSGLCICFMNVKI